MTNLHVLQHDPAEDAGMVGEWARARGYAVATTHLYRDESLPDPAGVDFLLLMGGPMNIYQDRDYPWLRGERAFIATHIAAGKPAIGICLGSQFLADALGGRVMQNPHVEIGWFPVNFTPEARARFPSLPAAHDVLHWHGDTFELPAGAIRLATSAACSNQGFLSNGRILALQCHLEMTREQAAGLIAADAPQPAAFVQSGETILARPEAAFTAAKSLLNDLLDAIFPPERPGTPPK